MHAHLFSKKLKQFSNNTLIFFLISCFFISTFFFAKIFFKVYTIEVFGKNKNLPIYGISNLKDNNLLFSKVENLQKELYEVNPALRQISIEKKFPNNLLVTIQYHQPLVIFKAYGGVFYLSESGKIISKKKQLIDNTLPILNFYQKIDFNSFPAGENLDYEEIIAALKYLKRAKELGFFINTIDIAGTYMIGLNLKESKIIFSTEKNIDRQLLEFETVIKHFKIQGQKFVKLDFRFNKPIVELN